MCGCINIVPVPRIGEKEEARQFGKVLHEIIPENERQLMQEHTTAQQLRITLEEVGTLAPGNFRDRFNAYIDRLTAVRAKRRDLRDRIREKNWTSPIVFTVQANCVEEMEEQILRDQQWIEWAQGVRLRVEIGQQKNFPELQLLRHALDNFLALSAADPLSPRLSALLDEFRLSEAQVI